MTGPATRPRIPRSLRSRPFHVVKGASYNSWIRYGSCSRRLSQLSMDCLLSRPSHMRIILPTTT